MATLSTAKSKIVQLINEQKTMLEMSEQDIEKGRLISKEVMVKRNLELLNAIQEGIDSGIAHDFDPIKHLEFLKDKKHLNS